MTKYTVKLEKEIDADNIREATKKFWNSLDSFGGVKKDTILIVHSDNERELIKVSATSPTHCYNCKWRPEDISELFIKYGSPNKQVIPCCPKCKSPNLI